MRAKGKNRKSRMKHLAKMGTTTKETINNHKRELEKKRVKNIVFASFISFFARIASGILVVLLISLIDCTPDDSATVKSNTELDRIKSYCVDVVPQSDGSLEITYDIVWLVLDGESDGPLSWVKLGIANRNCELVGFDGAVESVDISGTYAKIYLDREYGTGETVQFSICVNQGSMLCRNEQDETNPFYEFTPGWFDSIKVDNYRFTWAYSDGIVSQNSDERLDEKLLWSGKLNYGESRDMRVYYNIDSFDSPKLVDYSPSAGSSCTDDQIMVIIVLIAIIVLIYVIDSYNNGSGFKSGRGHYHGHSRGGGRSCACAGCACACACAGGGRAGCSVKDFYSNQADEEITVSSDTDE